MRNGCDEEEVSTTFLIFKMAAIIVVSGLLIWAVNAYFYGHQLGCN